MPSRIAGALRRSRQLVLIAFCVSCFSDNDLFRPADPDAGGAQFDGVSSLTGGVAFVAAADGAVNSGNTLTLSRPAGTQAGDVMIAQIVTSGTVQPLTLDGWTLIRGDYTGTEANAYVFWRRAEEGEPSSYGWRTSVSAPVAGGIVAYRNVLESGDPIDGHAGQPSTSGSGITAPSLTTTVDGAYLVALFSAFAERKETSLAFTPPAGMTERYDISSRSPAASARNVVAMHASVPLAAAGASGTRTATLNASRPGWGQALALRPGTGAPPPPPPPPTNQAPVAKPGGPYTAVEGSALTLDGSASSDPDGDALTWNWSFGDGSSTAGGAKPGHTYADNGTYKVVLTVTDPYGAWGKDSTTATITNAVPSVTLSVSPASVTVGQSVSVSGSFSDPGAADAPWAWEIDWGDGTKQNGTTSVLSTPIGAARAYAAAGSYTVTLSVTDKDGGKGTASRSVTVSTGGETNVWYTDFSEYPAGQMPTGWSQPYTASNWQVVNSSGATGGKVLYNSTGVSAYHVLRWDAVGSRADLEIETLTRVVPGSTFNESMALMARGVSGTPTFYASRLDSGSGLWTLGRYDNGNSSALATWANPFPIGTWVRHRFRVEGNTLKVKLWAAGTTEPATWTLEAIDANPLGAGSAGVWMRRGNNGTSINEFDWVRVTALGGTVEPPAPSVAWVWSGAQTASGAMVKTRLTGPSSSVRLRISTDSLFSVYSETAPTATSGNDVATFVLNGYASNTRYFYRVVSGSTADMGKQGAFRTLAAAGSPYSFTFALGSCQRTDSNSGVFNHVRAANALFWLQTGDIHYRNIASNDISLFRTAYNALHDQSNQAALFRSLPIVHVWDDHDGAGGNDTDGTRTGWPAARAAYRESVPHHALATGENGAIYHSFVIGRVRFIVSDLRSERSPVNWTDNSSKTMFGTAQKQYFKDQLALAKANGQFVAWVSTIPWIAAPTAGADHWGGYATERQEIADYIQAIGIGGQMFQLSGDMHATAIDSGVNNVWGGFPVFNAGPIDQSASTKGGPYTHGPFTNGTVGEQFGLVTITDNGGSQLQVRFSGRRNGAEIPGAAYQFTLTLNSAAN